MTWFAEGDRNTSFFHNHVNGKRKKLQLKSIQTCNGIWIEEQEELANAAVDFYQRQFTNEGDSTDFSLLDNVLTMVTLEQNLELSRFPTLEEVKVVVFELSVESSSGPDGFAGLFYQTCWEGFMKILVTCAKENDIFKTFHHYDMEFGVKQLVFSIDYGQSSGFFKSTRGVKQGDPLSPALIILPAEVLSRPLNKLFEDKSFVEFGMPKWFDPLNHRVYANDTIIFASPHPPSLSKIMVVLGSYERISGQMINKPKSSYYMHLKVANGLF
uniref:Uncharacterized protein LOC104229514 n=1 Tax=Nicotiana sylvestris TaxID=4096 RepID=A0A1U7X1X4_NICSY|nr:PREDICTED: uncharacterized protein LOC104229514 [Nicotiana sylvestris]